VGFLCRPCLSLSNRRISDRGNQCTKTIPADEVREGDGNMRRDVSFMVKFLRSLSKRLSSKDLKFSGLVLLFACFFSLRFYHLGYHDLWYDEMGTISLAKVPWKIWNAPFYWIFMHFWIKLSGVSELSLRFPAMIFSFASVILTYLLGKNLFNKKVGVLASLFIGLSPFHLWYAQEARDYSMVLFFGTAASYFLVRAIKEEKWVLWLLFVVASAGGLYANYFYIFLLLAQSLCVLSVQRTRLGFKETLCLLIIAGCFLPQLSKFLDKFHTVRQGFWILEPWGRSLLITLENFILGYNGTSILYTISNVLAGIFFMLALWAARLKEFRRSFLFCACLLFIPVLTAFFFSRMLFSVYIDRGFLLFSPYCYLLLALGAASLNRVPRYVLLGVFVLLLLIGDYRFSKDLMVQPIVHHMGTYIKKPIKPAAQFLRENVVLGEDKIAFTNVSTMSGFHFYERSLGTNMGGGTKTQMRAAYKGKYVDFYFLFDPELVDTTWKTPQRESRTSLPMDKIKQLSFKRLWVVANDWARSGGFDENSGSAKAWLDKNLKLEFSKEIDGLWVSRYVKDGS
jgi:hypothetical protein